MEWAMHKRWREKNRERGGGQLNDRSVRWGGGGEGGIPQLTRREIWDPARLKMCWGSSWVSEPVCMSPLLFPSPSPPVTLAVIDVWWELSYCHLVLRCSNYSVADLIPVISLIYFVCIYDMKSSCFLTLVTLSLHRFCLTRLRGPSSSSCTPSLKSEYIIMIEYISLLLLQRKMYCMWHLRAICDFSDPH